MKTDQTRHRVYLASSWRNEAQPAVLAALRGDGHEVYDFRNPAPGDAGFGWRQIGDRATWTADYFSTHVLDHPIAEHGFSLDMNALKACSACVLLLPLRTIGPPRARLRGRRGQAHDRSYADPRRARAHVPDV